MKEASFTSMMHPERSWCRCVFISENSFQNCEQTNRNDAFWLNKNTTEDITNTTTVKYCKEEKRSKIWLEYD